MIPEINSYWQTHDWQGALKRTITCPAELAKHLMLPEDLWSEPSMFGLKIPETMLGRIKKGDPNDPVLKQFLPVPAEEQEVAGFVADPLVETAVNPIPGLLQKFGNRVLLTLSEHCAVHCRYCFRRNFNYADNTPGKMGWDKAYAYIADNPQIEEVILSGGDPLSLPDHYLSWHFERIASIKHIRVIRIHTRLPIVIPQRVTQGLIETLHNALLPVVVVLHANHAQEINQDVKKACAGLSLAGARVLNQTVLLRGINDTVAAQRALAWALFECGVTPYYLHCFDPVKGAAHFDVPVPEAQALYQNLREVLPGYLVPQLVKEVPGAKAKKVV